MFPILGIICIYESECDGCLIVVLGIQAVSCVLLPIPFKLRAVPYDVSKCMHSSFSTVRIGFTANDISNISSLGCLPIDGSRKKGM